MCDMRPFFVGVAQGDRCADTRTNLEPLPPKTPTSHLALAPKTIFRAHLYARDISPIYSTPLLRSVAFFPMSTCMRSKNFMDQSVAIDGGKLLRTLSNLAMWFRSVASDRSRSISARAFC